MANRKTKETRMKRSVVCSSGKGRKKKISAHVDCFILESVV